MNMSSNSSNQGNALLEEWPTSDRSETLLEDWPAVESPRPKEKKSVRISEYSEVRIFNNRSYISQKSYTKDDVDGFKAQISIEASGLQTLISRFSRPTGAAIHSALGIGMLKIENLIGMEHLITPSAREQFVLERKTHSDLVLRAQKLLQEKRDCPDEISAVMLAKAASISSSTSTKKAVLRASMSLKAPEGAIQVSRKVSSNSNSSSTKSSKPKSATSPMDSVKLAHARTARLSAKMTRAAFAA